MSQSARELVANVRHELAAVLPTQQCCRAAELDGLRDAGFALGVKVRVVAADLSDPDGCYSSSTSTVEAG